MCCVLHIFHISTQICRIICAQYLQRDDDVVLHVQEAIYISGVEDMIDKKISFYL